MPAPFLGDPLTGCWKYIGSFNDILVPSEVKKMVQKGELTWDGKGWHWPKKGVTLTYFEAA